MVTHLQDMFYYRVANPATEPTTLSPFLSVKTMAPHLDCKGPSFTLDVLQSIARILHRRCPTEAEIADGCKEVQSTEDNLWASSGEENLEEEAGGWDSLDDAKTYSDYRHSFKRRRIGPEERSQKPLCQQVVATTFNSMGPLVTMQNGSTFSISSTSLQTGFISAGSHLKDLAQRQSEKITQESRDSTRFRKMTAQSSAVSKKSVPAIELGRETEPLKSSGGQGTLLNFFARSTKTQASSRQNPQEIVLSSDMKPPLVENSCMEESLPLAVEPGHDTSILRLPQDAHTISRPREPTLHVPKPLAGHGLRSAPLSTRPGHVPRETSCEPKQYPFFSSSPPPPESPLKEAEAEVTTSPTRQKLSKQDGIQTAHQVSDVRPATTYHTTNTTQVRYAQPAKTLGVRRSMNGWTNRGGSSFSVPSRRS